MNKFVLDFILRIKKFFKGFYFIFYYLELGYKLFFKIIIGEEMELLCLVWISLSLFFWDEVSLIRNIWYSSLLVCGCLNKIGILLGRKEGSRRRRNVF